MDSEVENQESQQREENEGENEGEEELSENEMRWVGSAVLLKIIELEKEMDLMRETLSILKDFSIEHLYLLLSAGDELVSRKQRALVNFGKHEFYGEYEEKDFAKILDKISDS